MCLDVCESLNDVQGVIELVSDYVICRPGESLTSSQAALLRIFDVKMAAFKMHPIGYWLSEGTHVELS